MAEVAELPQLSAGGAKPRKTMGTVSLLLFTPTRVQHPLTSIRSTALHGVLLRVGLDLGRLCQLGRAFSVPASRIPDFTVDRCLLTLRCLHQAGTVNLLLSKMYPKQYGSNHRKLQEVRFAGTS